MKSLLKLNTSMQMIIVFAMWTNLETYKLLMKNLMLKNKHLGEEILPKTL